MPNTECAEIDAYAPAGSPDTAPAPALPMEAIDVRHHADGWVSARTAERFLDGKELTWMRKWSYATDIGRAAVPREVRPGHLTLHRN